MGKRLELTDQRFGRLTVIELAYKDKWGSWYWKCSCDCGNEKIIRGRNLKKGFTKSCGCLWKESVEKNLKKRIIFPKGVAACNKIINDHKYRAKIKNLKQALTDEQIIEIHKGNCHYCGSPPSKVFSKSALNGSYIYNGIDRIDNTKGYTLANVVSCCSDCNYAKRKMTYDEFLDLITRIHSHLKL